MCATSSPTHRSITSGSGYRPSHRSPQASRRRPLLHTPQQPLRLRHLPPFHIVLVPSLAVDAVVVEASCPRPTTQPTTSRTRTCADDDATATGTDDIRTVTMGIANARLTATATRHPSRVTSCFATYHHRPHSVRTRQSVTATHPLLFPTLRPPRRPAIPCLLRSIGGTTWTSPRRWST